jgi:hypothetical protein
MRETQQGLCRCGHDSSFHVNGRAECKRLGDGGRWCLCTGYVAEDARVYAAREQCMHEILEHIVTLDRRYARLPRPPW